VDDVAIFLNRLPACRQAGFVLRSKYSASPARPAEVLRDEAAGRAQRHN